MYTREGRALIRTQPTIASLILGTLWLAVAGCQSIDEAPREAPVVGQANPEPIVTLASRLGEIVGKRQGEVLHFLGVRYAEPPVGERRFLPPVAAAPWSDTRDATHLPNRCIQPAFDETRDESARGTSEDCLFLNIVTPSVEGPPRPVLVWIHGGGFALGSANEYDSSMLAAQGDVVVVTINYRLGLLGFLDLSPLGEEFAGSASNGFRDQILALEWVRDNIADYGGDPGNVTIFGGSAGGHSVHALLAAPSADGLFHKAIAHSPGTVNTPPDDLLTPLAAELGLEGDALLAHLRAMSAEAFLAAQGAVGTGVGGMDGTVVTRSTNDAILERGARGVPLIAGTNRDEGTLFSVGFDPATHGASERRIARFVTAGADPAPYLNALTATYPDAEPKEIHERIWGDMFRKAAIDSTERATAAGPGGWLYRFDLPASAQWQGLDLGMPHGAEIPFTFNRFNSAHPGGVMFHDPNDPVVRDLAQRWSDTIIAFARTGDPNGAGLPYWPRYGDGNRHTLVLDEAPRVEVDLDRVHRALWETH